MDNFRKSPLHIWGLILNIKKIFNVKGIYDINQNKCKKYSKLFNIKYFKSLNELLNSRSDILVIAINYQNNLTVIKNICKSKKKPKIILCEKLISNEIISANKIFKLCKKK